MKLKFDLIITLFAKLYIRKISFRFISKIKLEKISKIILKIFK